MDVLAVAAAAELPSPLSRLEAYFATPHCPSAAQVATLKRWWDPTCGRHRFSVSRLSAGCAVAVAGDGVFEGIIALAGSAPMSTAPYNCRAAVVYMGAHDSRVALRTILTTHTSGDEDIELVLDPASIPLARDQDDGAFAAAIAGGACGGLAGRAAAIHGCASAAAAPRVCELWPSGTPYYHGIQSDGGCGGEDADESQSDAETDGEAPSESDAHVDEATSDARYLAAHDQGAPLRSLDNPSNDASASPPRARPCACATAGGDHPPLPGACHATHDAVMSFPDTLLQPRVCVRLGGGQVEVVARHDIPRGTCFLYGGYETQTHSGHSMQVDTYGEPIHHPRDAFVLEGGSVARYVNYFRGFAPEGNVTFASATYETAPGMRNRVVVFLVALRDIAAGELVLVRSYARDYDMFLDRMSALEGRFVSRNEAASLHLPDIPFNYEAGDVVASRDAATGVVVYYLLLEPDAASPARWTAEELCAAAGPDGTTFLVRPPGSDTAQLDVGDIIPLAYGWEYEAAAATDAGSDDESADAARIVVKYKL